MEKSAHPKILIIESLKESLSEIVHLLKQSSENYAVEVCHIQDLSFEHIKLWHPDLILMDDGLDKNSCYEICHQVRALDGDRHTGIVFVSLGGAFTESMLIECLEYGADDFIRFNSSERELVARVNAVLRLKAMTDELRRVNHKLKILSLTDELTGLSNMRHFSQSLNKACIQARKLNQPILLVMMDLDRFKSVNDTQNHLVGSAVIKEVGGIFRDVLKLKSKFGELEVARYGGDEFIYYRRNIDLKSAEISLEELRSAIEKHIFVAPNINIKLTSSIGAYWIDDLLKVKSSDQLIKVADENLYKSKAQGRNCYTLSTFQSLRNAIDFDHVGGQHALNRNTSGDDNVIARLQQSNIPKKIG
ncbi:MAG: diguanylate cyclase [Oligoflexales bacterium]|nr:diguanylate cyclase [Oligoflexales bacterium]